MTKVYECKYCCSTKGTKLVRYKDDLGDIREEILCEDCAFGRDIIEDEA